MSLVMEAFTLPKIGPLEIQNLLGIELGEREIAACGPKPDADAILVPPFSLLDLVGRLPEKIKSADWVAKCDFAATKMGSGWLIPDWEARHTDAKTLDELLAMELPEGFRPPTAVEAIWMALLVPNVMTRYTCTSLITSDRAERSVVSIQKKPIRMGLFALSFIDEWGGSIPSHKILLPVQKISASS